MFLPTNVLVFHKTPILLQRYGKYRQSSTWSNVIWHTIFRHKTNPHAEINLESRYFRFKKPFKTLFQYTVFSRLNAGGVYLKLGLAPGVYTGPSVYLLNAFFSHPFFNITVGSLLNQEPNFNKNVKNVINFVSSK